jgi:YD repeat-containing protein
MPVLYKYNLRVFLFFCLFASLFISMSTSRAAAANGSVAYTYDALGRVVTASYDTGVCVIYSYDANGNRLSQTINVGTGGTPTWGTGTWGCFNWTPH